LFLYNHIQENFHNISNMLVREGDVDLAIESVLNIMISHFDHVALFLWGKRYLNGYLGKSALRADFRERIKNLSVEYNNIQFLKKLYTEKTLFAGPPPGEGGYLKFLDRFLERRPQWHLLYPVEIMGKVVGMWYADTISQREKSLHMQTFVSLANLISLALKTLPVVDGCEIWAEPGRALVAEAASTLVRVDLRRDGILYINDGTYGSLFDAGMPGFIFPARAIRPTGKVSGRLAAFSFYGPTCDSLDFMKGPFMLADDIGEGDYIEIGLTGAYGSTMRTQFNGFYSDEMAVLSDAPMLTMYRPGASTDWPGADWPSADESLQQNAGNAP